MLQNDYRPGFAKRSPHFALLLDRAGTVEPDPSITAHRLDRALKFGAPWLPSAEYRLLSICIELSATSIARGHYFCFAKNATLERLSGFDRATLKRLRANLESRYGLVIRHYTRSNHSPYRHGLDFRPLVSRLKELEDAAEAMFQVGDEEHEANTAAETLGDFQGSNNSPRGRISAPHRQSPLSQGKETVTGASNAAPQSAASRSNARLEAAPLAGPVEPPPHSSQLDDPQQPPQDCSPGRASGDFRARSRTSSDRGKAIAALLALRELSPTWARYVDEGTIRAGDLDQIIELTRKAVIELWPTHNTATSTFDWGVQRYGWRVCQVFVAAVEDSSVKSPQKMFGYLISHGPVNLTNNLKRIKLERARAALALANAAAAPLAPAKAGADAEATAPAPESADEPIWAEIKAELARDPRIDRPTMRSWITPLVCSGLSAGVLYLRANSRFAADRVRAQFVALIIEAARRAGHYLDDVEVSPPRS